ncbi:hypothetical protein NTGM5_850003 [Candidatus Nitrotoga sp. M5]|nr:hypothetical protein NTGM5_850003 [Candidatus Nitrotoga sp. M5]
MDFRLKHFATRVLYDELLRAGMAIYEYYASCVMPVSKRVRQIDAFSYYCLPSIIN